MVRSNIMSAPYNAAVLAGVTATAGEINMNDVTTKGTVEADKTVTADTNKDITGARNVTATGAVQGATIVGTTSMASPAIDAGSSGAAGSVDIFPSTGSKGKIALTAADSAGNTTTTIVNASQAAARTYTIPDALASAMFLLGKQGAVARTATAAGDGTGLIADGGMFQFIAVTAKTADATGIIVLPTPTPGTIIVLAVGATGYELRTSTPASIGINGGTGADAESAIGANTLVLAICESATSWKALQMGSDGTLAKVEVAA